MFRNANGEARFPSGPGSPSSPQLASVTFDGQESSWIGLLSRPALSLLRRLRLWGAAPAEISNSFIGEENDILRQLNGIMPFTPPVGHQFTRCKHDGVPGVGLLDPGTGGPVSWMSAGMDHSLQPQISYFSSIRAHINKNLKNPQEVQGAGGRPLVPVSPPMRSSSAGKIGPWWGSFIQIEESSETCLLSEVTETGRLCSPSVAQIKAPPTDTTPVLESVLPENAGPPCLDDSKAPHRVQNKAGFTEGERGCRGAGLPLPEHDNGYSSLEEEHSQMGLLSQLRAPSEEGNQLEPSVPQMEEIPEQPEPEEVVSVPQCQNKSIAFIMGCPCSDDESSQSESDSESDDDDDDDGFDSEGSSDLSDSSNEDEDDEASDSDSEPDSESERLWTSLCQSQDPYNPRNFTARLHTGPPARTAPTLPVSVPAPSPASTPHSPPASSPTPISASPPSSQDTWDDSTSASEVDEAESLRLLSSFSCSADPYSPLNFKAPLRTQGPTEPPPKTRNRTSAMPQTPPQALHHNTASPPEYRKEGAEERLDSGFSEASTTQQSCKIPKKVHFSDTVEEHLINSEEDRRGPWEELARDRCRFLRRCQEVEQSIGFCLQPQHRQQMFQRLNALSDT
uniref:Protein phosphatase 1 regulatory subunit 15B-like n=1 Tax=Cyprinodon variegatus TaxID=28743 RepID=A0A3Q2G0N6_CYPVA